MVHPRQMKPWVAYFLLLAMTCVGTGLAEWLHVTHDHAHAVEQGSYAGPRLKAVADSDTDPAHCHVCATLHAPTLSMTFAVLDVRMELAVDRVLALQAQRLDDSIPAPRGCRGPPLV